MTTEEFVRALQMYAMESAAENTITNLAKPPGRRPRRSDVERSAWFNALSEADRTRVAEVARKAADYTLFGVLCILDGVRVIVDGEDKGTFRLSFEKDGTVHELLPIEHGDYLHDILRAVDAIEH